MCDLETSRICAPYIYIYIYDISSLRVNFKQNSAQDMSTVVYWATVNCVKISTVKVINYLGPSMDFCLYYPHLISDLGGTQCKKPEINPLNAELNPICHLLALLGAHHILHVSRIRVNEIKHLRVFLKTGTG